MLTDEQQQTWLAYMRVVLRLNYEMNRQLQTESGLSLPDYHVLNALGDSDGGRLRLTALAGRIGWERSRASHHLRRMAGRGLVELLRSTGDGRATEAVLTEQGRAALQTSTPGHAALVHRMFFEGLDEELVRPLRTALEEIHAQVLRTGTLPAPGQPQRRLSGLPSRDREP